MKIRQFLSSYYQKLWIRADHMPVISLNDNVQGSAVIQSGARTPSFSMFEQQKGSIGFCDTLYSHKLQ